MGEASQDITGIPAPGQLVTVRQRRMVVNEVRPSSAQLDLYADVADQKVQHLISLQSVEDDGLGEELEVIWEIEPGTRIFERATLPDPGDGFDDPARLDAFLDAVRWGAVASADVRHLNAPFRSGITIEDYQLDPVVRALQMPRVNLLIADDVGLGKTIESGLVLQELLLRHRARSVLVVCPAGLQIQWRDQMRDKFGLEFRIVDSKAMKTLRRRRGLHVNPWTHFPRLITSIDFIKRERPMRLFREILPPEGQPAFPRKFDLMILDEAHNVAPPGRGNYALDSLRTQAIRTLAPHFEHKLFLSATPHNGYTESFSALLELLDDQRFHRAVEPDRKQLAAVMVRRLKRELPPDDLGRPRFPERKLEALEVAYSDEEREAHALLTQYSKTRIKHAQEGAEAFATEFVLKLLKKRLFSSPEAFRLTLEKHEQTVRHGKKKTKPKKTNVGILRREVESAEEDNADDEAYEERYLDVVTTTSSVLRPISDEEDELLTQLRTWAGKASGKADSKARALIDWLNDTVRPGGKWNDERVIIFTEYRATQNWLQGLLAAEGLTAAARLLTIYGGMPTDEREAVKAAFQAGPDVSNVRILLATDAASEGIDLQNHCSRLIHYEIPWNPNRLEQRNGRVDRHGQRASKVSIFHFVAEGYSKSGEGREPGQLEGDLEFLMRAAVKVDQIREDLGNVGDVIATQVEEAMLGRRRRLEPEKNNQRAKAARAMLRFERKLREQLDKLHERLQSSRQELRLSPDNVRRVVEVGLDIAGFPPLRAVEVPDRDGKGVMPAYHLPALAGSWAPCAEGLAHPHTQEIRPVVFDNDLVANRDDIVLAHLGHRLVQMCLRLLRAEVWAPEGERKLSRVSARIVPDAALEHPVVIGHARLVVLGGDNERLHEEVLTAGGALKGGRFSRLNVGDTNAALDAARTAEAETAPDALGNQLQELWAGHAESLMSALDARMKDRTNGLFKLLIERADREVADLTQVLTELEASIKAEMGRSSPPQLSLWPTQEQQQYERNREVLRLRAESLPAEIERESEAIRSRYRDPVPRLFPAAVTYVVPRRLA